MKPQRPKAPRLKIRPYGVGVGAGAGAGAGVAGAGAGAGVAGGVAGAGVLPLLSLQAASNSSPSTITRFRLIDNSLSCQLRIATIRATATPPQ